MLLRQEFLANQSKNREGNLARHAILCNQPVQHSTPANGENPIDTDNIDNMLSNYNCRVHSSHVKELRAENFQTQIYG